jgi:hypothetical protein
MACQTFVNGDVSVSWVPLAERQASVPRSEPSPVEAATPSEPPVL